jgi:hypothetical protein
MGPDEFYGTAIAVLSQVERRGPTRWMSACGTWGFDLDMVDTEV